MGDAMHVRLRPERPDMQQVPLEHTVNAEHACVTCAYLVGQQHCHVELLSNLQGDTHTRSMHMFMPVSSTIKDITPADRQGLCAGHAHLLETCEQLRDLLLSLRQLASPRELSAEVRCEGVNDLRPQQ